MKYPGGIKLTDSPHNKENIKYGNRGMNLESDLNITNEYYRTTNRAVIYKKPTPIKVMKVDYQNRAIIKEAFFEYPSTTDYNGIYKGKYIDFEAKETLSKTSFPLNNIHIHQIDHIRRIVLQEGIVFLIVSFAKIDETYLLFGNDFIDYIDNNNRASIPIDYFRKKGHLLNYNYNPRIDYLDVIDQVYGGKNE